MGVSGDRIHLMHFGLDPKAPAGLVFKGRDTDAEKGELLRQAWLLVRAASREGWGMVVMKAAAKSTPTVAFGVEGIRDAIVDGGTGLLVAAADREKVCR